MRKAALQTMYYFQESVAKLSAAYTSRRPSATATRGTPTSYHELLGAFRSLLDKRAEVKRT